MTEPSLEDHALGVELQLNELVEEQARARVQHIPHRVSELQAQIDALQQDLADTAERLVGAPPSDGDDPLRGRTILDP